MEIVHSEDALLRYMARAVQVSGRNPVLIDSYLQDAIEVDVDAVADRKTVFVAGVMEHIEEAGIHSGDSACSLPPYTLSPEIIAEIERQTERARPRPRRRRADEHAVCREGRGHLRAGGQSARQPHRALRRQGHRRPHRQDRRARHGRRAAGGFRPGQAPPSPHRGQGSRLPLRPLPRRRRHPGAGDEIDRRGHGAGFQLRAAPSPSPSSARACACRSPARSSSRSRTRTRRR